MSSLQEALNQRKSKIEKTVATKASASGKKKSKARRRANQESPTRNNTRLIGGHFPPEIVHQWHLLVAEEKINGATGQALLHEAISDLFVKKGKKALRPPGEGRGRTAAEH